MESIYDVEINTKVQEIIEKLLLPYKLSLMYVDEFSEQMQNPKIAARIDVEIDRKVEEITKYIELACRKLEKSFFYRKFMEQMKDPEIAARIESVIGTDPHHSQLQLVLYGVGRMSPQKGWTYKQVEKCQMQLAFAILLREKFQWVGDIEVFDPVLSPLERIAIDKFNCTCLSVDENCKRTVDRPTLFFMPHCATFHYENLLASNWTPGNLSKIIILGNTFSGYRGLVSSEKTSNKRIKALGNSDQVLLEILLPVMDKPYCTAAPKGSPHSTYKVCSNSSDSDPVFFKAFTDLGWLFFAWNSSLDDLNLHLSSEERIQRIKIR